MLWVLLFAGGCLGTVVSDHDRVDEYDEYEYDDDVVNCWTRLNGCEERGYICEGAESPGPRCVVVVDTVPEGYESWCCSP